MSTADGRPVRVDVFGLQKGAPAGDGQRVG